MIFLRPITQRFSEMDALDLFQIVEVGQCSSHFEYPVVASCGQPHCIGSLSEECQTSIIGSSDFIEQIGGAGGI